MFELLLVSINIIVLVYIVYVCILFYFEEYMVFGVFFFFL